MWAFGPSLSEGMIVKKSIFILLKYIHLHIVHPAGDDDFIIKAVHVHVMCIYTHPNPLFTTCSSVSPPFPCYLPGISFVLVHRFTLLLSHALWGTAAGGGGAARCG